MTYRIPARVAWFDDDAEPVAHLYLAVVPDGAPLVLDEPARTIWLAARVGRSMDEVVERVAQEAQVPPDHIAADVRDFLRQLVAQGLLEDTP